MSTGPDFRAPSSATPFTPSDGGDARYPPVPQQNQAPAYAPTGELVLNLKKPAGSMGMLAPVVRIDGYPVQVAWGRTSVPAPAGTRQVEVATSYLWTYGRATLAAEVRPGATTEVFYSGPWLTFLGGAMGLTPQRKPGLTALVVILSVVGLLVLLAVAGAVLSTIS